MKFATLLVSGERVSIHSRGKRRILKVIFSRKNYYDVINTLYNINEKTILQSDTKGADNGDIYDWVLINYGKGKKIQHIMYCLNTGSFRYQTAAEFYNQDIE